jgi:hypothetical protein
MSWITKTKVLQTSHTKAAPYAIVDISTLSNVIEADEYQERERNDGNQKHGCEEIGRVIFILFVPPVKPRWS